MDVLIQWWPTVKNHEGILQYLGRDPAGNVSYGYLMANSAKQLTTPFRISFYSPCFITDPRKKGARISGNFMISVSYAVEISYF